ncbi:MAG TPA: FABP family protein, partial [Pseudonocardiaceae bacterium]|nr:FABP family protein [Pseudonocardiaceae bacterium]
MTSSSPNPNPSAGSGDAAIRAAAERARGTRHRNLPQ